jgi:hypothetical protein
VTEPVTRDSAPVPAVTRAPSDAAELTDAEKRALREQARRAFIAEQKARLAKTASAASPAKKKGAEPAAIADEPVTPGRSDEDRARDAAMFLRGVLWPVLALGAVLFGYRLEPLSDEAALEDGKSWVPVARRYRWFDVLITWASAPARVVARVKELARKEPPKPATVEGKA